MLLIPADEHAELFQPASATATNEALGGKWARRAHNTGGHAALNKINKSAASSSTFDINIVVLTCVDMDGYM